MMQYPDQLFAALTYVERMAYEDPRSQWPEERRARWLEQQAQHDGRPAVAEWLAEKVLERIRNPRHNGKWLVAVFIWEMTGEHKVLVELIKRLM